MRGYLKIRRGGRFEALVSIARIFLGYLTYFRVLVWYLLKEIGKRLQARETCIVNRRRRHLARRVLAKDKSEVQEIAKKQGSLQIEVAELE